MVMSLRWGWKVSPTFPDDRPDETRSAEAITP
jgi:hypothetical protein